VLESSATNIISSTVGVIFLATPFKLSPDVKSRWKRLGIILPEDVSSTSSTSKQHNEQEERTGIENPPGKALNIKSINSEFVQLVTKEGFRVSCFYECLVSNDSTLGKVI
jgi:hypothetical protein